MPRYTEEEHLASIEHMLPYLAVLAPPGAVPVLEAELQACLETARQPASRPLAVTRALKAIRPHNNARRWHALDLQQGGPAYKNLGAFGPYPGGPQVVKPGDMAECPLDSGHFHGRVIVARERCPVCNLLLRPLQEAP